MSTRPPGEARYGALVIVAVALAGALVTYAVVGSLFLRGAIGPPPAPMPGADILRWVFVGLAIVELGLSRFVRDRVFAARGGDAAAYVTATVTALALAEAPGVLGLVWVVLTRSAVEFWALLALAAFGLALGWPRRAEFDDAARRAR